MKHETETIRCSIMCGINAILSKGKADKNTVLAMNKCLAHRGPDEGGFYISKNGMAALGHRRLSIIDLSPSGRQPMFNEDSTVFIIFNGEIYNYKQLRKELENRHKFHSTSDTEVMIHLYEDYGFRMIEKLRGMFAFVIYDERENLAFAARDRFGEKPLVYAETEDGIYISSEIRAIAENAKIDREINLEGLGYYFLHNFRHIPEPFTIYKGIKKLLPAHYMLIQNGEIKSIERYWKPTFAKKKYGEREAIEKVRQKTIEAIRSREIADVEISALLSGGVDSSAVAAATAADVEGLRTYALGNSKEDEELLRARKVAEMFKTKHKEFVFNADQLDVFEKIIEHYGEPIYVIQLAYAYTLFEAVRKDNIKVTLTGNGGDELFFGYDGSARLLRMSEAFNTLGILGKAISPLGSLIGGDAGIFLKMFGVEKHKRKGEIYREKARIFSKLLAREQFEKIRNVDFGKVIDDVCAQCDSEYYIDMSYYAGLMLENAHSVTIIGDLPAMMNSIEARAPFLDHELAELSFSMHPKLKVGNTNKYILKKALEGILSNEILYAKKMGFGYNISIPQLIRTKWRERFGRRILFGKYTKSGIFNMDFINTIFEEHMNGKDHSKLLLALYAFSVWYEKFME